MVKNNFVEIGKCFIVLGKRSNYETNSTLKAHHNSSLFSEKVWTRSQISAYAREDIWERD